MTKKYRFSVFIGRFQPFHSAHALCALHGLKIAETLIFVLGSSNSPPTIKNPWSAPEREAMIRASFPNHANRLKFVYAEDRLYQDHEWVRQVQHKVGLITGTFTGKDIALIGHDKDDSSYYLNYFKVWDYVPVKCGTVGSDKPLSSTKIRELMFEGFPKFIENAVPPAVYAHIRDYVSHPLSVYHTLKDEYHAAVAYEKQYDGYPYAVNFLTVDAVVIQSGHILLVQRGGPPGKGLWALPGGHVQPNENLLTAVIRELKEETEIKVPDKVLRGSIFHREIFDHPDRSLRARLLKKNGRTVTVAYGFKLDDTNDLPRVSGADDAAKAWWFTFDEVSRMRDQLFEDHADIISDMLGNL